MDRKKLLGLIHIARNSARLCPECGKVVYGKRCKECGRLTDKLDDGRYRRILESFGASSCRFMPDSDLEKVYRFFIQAGFKPRDNPEKSHAVGRKRTMAITIAEAKALFGEEMWESRLSGFIRKAIGKPDLRSCDDKELRKAIGWLRRYRKYLDKRQEEKSNEERD